MSGKAIDLNSIELEPAPFKPINWFTTNIVNLKSPLEYCIYALKFNYTFKNVCIDKYEIKDNALTITGKSINYYMYGTNKIIYCEECPYTICITQVPSDILTSTQNEGNFNVVFNNTYYNIDITIHNKIQSVPCVIKGNTDKDIQDRYASCPTYDNPVVLEKINCDIPAIVLKIAFVNVSIEF
jgi:hypothetical protein